MLVDLTALAFVVALAATGARRGVLASAPYALGAAAGALVLLLFGRLLASAFRQAFELPLEAAGPTSALAAFACVYAAAYALAREALWRWNPEPAPPHGVLRRVAGASVGALHGVLVAWWLLSAAALFDRPVRGFGRVVVPAQSSSLIALCRRVNLVALGGDAAVRDRLGVPR